MQLILKPEMTSRARPILFSSSMVQALLAGRKTQTRRVIKDEWFYGCLTGDCQHGSQSDCDKAMAELCPYGQPGDLLYVRETTCIAPKSWGSPDKNCITDNEGALRFVSYKADAYDEEAMLDYKLKWTPSIHVPRWASRITLEVVSVRCERLQEINNSDAQAEGMEHAMPHRHGLEGLLFEVTPSEIVNDPYAANHSTGFNDCWICAFRSLWQTINLKRGFGWDENPYVWVVEFKVHKINIDNYLEKLK